MDLLVKKEPSAPESLTYSNADLVVCNSGDWIVVGLVEGHSRYFQFVSPARQCRSWVARPVSSVLPLKAHLSRRSA